MVKASLSRLSLAFAGLLLLSGLSCNPKLSGTTDVTVTSSSTGGTFGAPGTDFQISVAQDSIVVPAGGTGSNGMAVAWINCAPATIQVEIDGLPAGMADAFTINPTPDLTSVTLNADPNVPAGVYTVRLKGIAGNVLHDTHFSVIVPDSLVPDFSLALNPTALPITAGGSGTLGITVERLGGFSSAVSFTLDDAPAGVTGTFTTAPLPLHPRAALEGAAPPPVMESHSLLINVPASTPKGTYTMHVHATGGGKDHSIGMLMKVDPPADFSLGANPASVTVNQTDAFAPPIAVAITRASTFTGAVTFSLTGAPAGVTPLFTPNPTSSNATSLNLSLVNPAPGTYPLTIKGVSGALSHTTTVLLNVLAGGPDFQITTPATDTVDLTGLASGSKTSTLPVTLTQLLGFTRPVSLTATGLPAGVTAAFAPNPATPSAISTLTLTVPSSTAPGTSTVTVTGDGGSGLIHSTTFQLTIINPGTFGLAASSPVNLVLNAAGGPSTATSAISVIPANGFTGSVNLSASGLPAGVTAAFSPNPTTGASTLTFTATTPTALAGTSTVTISGVSGPVGASTTLTLNLLPGPDFTLSPGSSTISALPGGTATAAYTVNPLNGFTGTVAFSASGLPAGVTAAFAPSSSTTGSTLTLTVGAAVVPGAYTLTITGTSGALTHTATLTLQVRDFALSLSSASVSLPAGGSTTDTVTITALNGFAGSVNLSLLGAPAGLTGTFAPNPATTSSTLTLNATTAVAPGTYALTVQGVSGVRTRTTALSVTIQAFTLAATTPVNIVQPIPAAPANTGSSTVTITQQSGFSGNVTLSTSALPAGVTAAFGTNPATTSSVLTFSVTNAAAPGTYPITITGVSGGLTRTTTTTLNIAAFPDYSLSLSSPSLTLPAASSTTDTVSITGINGFASAVTLSLTGAPAGITATFAPNPATTTSTMTLTVTAAVAPGTYAMNVQGVGGGLTRTTALSVTVQAFTLSATTPVNIVQPIPAAPANTGSSTVTITQQSGFSGNVTLSTSALPAGVTAAFGTNPATTSSVLTFSVTNAAAPGTYPITITGVSGGLTRTTTTTLNIAAFPDYSLSLSSPSLTLPAASSTTDTVSITPINGFASGVTLSLTGAPAGITATFAPNPTTTTSTMTLSVTAAVAPGTYAMNVQGVGGGLTRTTALSVTVQAFTMAATTPVNIVQPIPAAPANTGSSTVTITQQSGFSGNVTLSTSALPAGVTAAFGTNPATTSSVLTFSVTNAAAPGSYPITITGVSGGLTRTTTTTLNIAAFPDYSLSLSSPSLTLPAASSTTDTVSITGINGFASAVTLSLTGAPAGVTATFAPNPATTTSTMTLTVTAAVAPGTYAMNVQGVGGGLTRTTALSVTVQAFTMAATTPVNIVQPIPAAPANTGSSTVTITQQSGFSGNVTLSTSALPAGVTAAFGTNPATTSSVLTFSVTNAAAPGTYPITITGVSGGLTRTTTTTLNIAAFPDYSLSLSSPSLSLPAASSTTDTVSITPINGFASAVTLSLTGAPAGVTATFAPNPATTTSTMTLSVTAAVAPGTYAMNVQGVGGGLTRTTALSVTVQAFTMAATTPVNIVQPIPAAPANTGSSTVTITQQSGFSGNVTLSTSALPAGVTAVFGTNPATTSSVLTFSVTNAAAPGSYPITITGVSGGLTRTTTTTLNIAAFPDFSLGLSSSSVTVQNGLSTTDGVTITGINGFAGNVTLSMPITPAGFTFTFSPNPATTAGSTLTIATNGAAAPGPYSLTIQGVSGGLTHTTTINITVTDFSLTAPASITANIPAPASPNIAATGTITVNALSGFAGSATLSVSGLPAGVTLTSFTPNPASTTSTMTLSVANTAVQGTTTVTVNGVSGGITRSTTFSLVLNGGFTLALAPNAMTLDIPASATNSGSTSLSATAFAGFSGNVTLSTSALPTGVTVGFAANPVATGSGTLVTIQTDSTATPGTYTITVNGVSGAQSASTTLSLTLQNTNFAVSASPNPVAFQVPATGASSNTSGSTTVSLTELGTGSGAVTLSLGALPTGVSGIFATNPATGSTTLTLTAGQTASPGSYTFTVTGTRGIYTNGATVTLNLAAAADFSLSASPDPLSIQVPEPTLSTSGGTSITVAAVNGFGNSVTFSAGAMPAGTSGSFTPASSTTGSTFTVTVNSSALPGSYPVVISATDGNITRTMTLTLALSASPTFGLTLTTGSITTIPGGGGSDTATITAFNGFSNPVALSLVGAPAGITAAFSPNPATSGSGYTSLMSLSVASSVAAGDYSFSVQGTDGFVTSTAAYIVHVQTYTITLTVPPSSTLPIIHRGSSSLSLSDTVDVTVTAVNGYAGTVNLSIPDLPAGSNPATIAYVWGATPNTTSVAVGGANPASATVALTLNVNSGVDGSVIPGVFTSTLTSSDGSIVFTNPVTDIFEDFSVPFTPITVMTSTSGNVSIPVSITRDPSGSPFDEDVVLSASALGPWATASFASGTGDLGTTGTTDTLNLASASGGPVAAGTYYITLTGTSSPSGIVRSANVAVTVAGFTLSIDTPQFVFYGAQPTPSGGGNLTITPDTSGYSGSVGLSTNNLNGLTWSFGTTPLAVASPTAASTTYNFSGLFSLSPLPAGVYTDFIRADDGAGTLDSKQVDVIVKDFSVADTQAVASATSGYNGTAALTLSRLPIQFPYDGDVTFTATDKNGEFTYSFAPATLSNPATGTVMTFTPTAVLNPTPGHKVFVNVVATDAVHGVTHSANVTITIGDFLVQPTPTTFTVYGTNNLSVGGSVAVPMAAGISSVTLSGTTGNGITYSFSPNPVTPAANPEQTTTTYNATTSTPLPPGVYTDTITGTDGTPSADQTANITITVYDFAITSITPFSTTGTSPSGGSTTVTINRTPVAGGPTYTDDLDMFASEQAGNPATGQFGVFVGSFPNIPSASNSGTLTITPNTSPIPPGTYNYDITVYGTTTPLQHVGTLTITVF